MGFAEQVRYPMLSSKVVAAQYRMDLIGALVRTAGLVKRAADHVPTIAVDLDGTLAHMYKKFDPNTIEDPRPGAKDALEKFKKRGWKIIIYTCRGNTALIEKWLKKHAIPFDYINRNPAQPADASSKLFCDILIDDRVHDSRISWEDTCKKIIRRLGR